MSPSRRDVPGMGTAGAYLLLNARDWHIHDHTKAMRYYACVTIVRTADGAWSVGGTPEYGSPVFFTLEVDDPGAVAFLEGFAQLLTRTDTPNGGKSCRWSEVMPAWLDEHEP